MRGFAAVVLVAAVAAMLLLFKASVSSMEGKGNGWVTLPVPRPTATATPTPTPGWWATEPAWLTPSPTPVYQVYEAQRGDTCQKVAERWGVTVETLKKHNPGLDCQKPLRKGFRLRIPVTPTPTPTLTGGEHDKNGTVE